MNDLLHTIALSKIPGVGPLTAKKLIAYVGSAEQVFCEKHTKLQNIPGIGAQLAKQLQQTDVLKEAEKEIEFIERYKIEALVYHSKQYPEQLRFCDDSPLVLFKKGKLDLQNQRIISIVGTRNASAYGKSFCERLVEDLKQSGYEPIITSGLAYGIDICAHKAALKNNLPTVAVLAHGLTTLYPASHRNTAEEIVEKGALLTEFTSDMRAFRNNFLSRNRIVAGMADATIVIESAEKGGALVTADMANGYSREVFALPGRIKDKYSAGCNKLIQKNKAILLTSAEDIVEALNWDVKKKIPVQKQLFVDLLPDEQVLADILKQENTAIDMLCKKSGFPVAKVSSLLLKLEFAGIVRSLPGKVFSLT